jgi:hypothetical protein
MGAPSPDKVAQARRLYREGLPVARIMQQTKLDRATFYACLDGRYDDGSGATPPPLPRRRANLRSRTALATRLWRAAEKQVGEIEERLAAAHLPRSERERDARVMAIVVKTLRELSAFDERNRESRTDVTEADDDLPPDDFPRDIDELRRELAKRISQL